MLARTVSALALVALALVGQPGVGLAAWSNSPDLNTPIANTSADEVGAFPLPDGSGGMFVAWSLDVGGGVRDVYAQHYNAQGIRTWTPGGVAVATGPADQVASPIVSDGAGGIVLIWLDRRNGNYDVFGQRLNAAGVAQWVANGVPVVVAPGEQLLSDYMSDGANGMIFTWYDTRAGNNDIYAQRVSPAGTALWGATGAPVCVQPNSQINPVSAPDGQGGVILAWQDSRLGPEADIYAQRLNALGVPQWAINGVPVCTATSDEYGVVIAPDLGGGAFIGWTDTRIAFENHAYLQHLALNGTPMWMPNGIQLDNPIAGSQNMRIASDGAGGCFAAWDAFNGSDEDVVAQRIGANGSMLWPSIAPICAAGGYQSIVGGSLASDGLGGAIVSWMDSRGLDNDLYAQRVSGQGFAQWNPTGVALATAAGEQGYLRMIADGANGYLFAFGDTRQATNQDQYVQRIERFGQLGSPEPRIVSVRDVSNDQGGQVRVAWNASYLDAGFFFDQYRLWRRVPVNLALVRIARGEALRVEPGATNTTYWELVGSYVANGFPSYSAVTSTEGDSIGGSNPTTVFMVEGRETMSGRHWDSAPDSGYSVDNLPPLPPSPFNGTYANGTSSLDWGASPSPDVAGYRLHRGTTSAFVPGPGNLVASPTQTSYVDVAGGLFWYKLAAVDVHGNPSGYVAVLPASTVDVESDDVPRELSLAPPAPNPTHAGAGFRLALPRSAHVHAAIYDQQGRAVRALHDGALSAGNHDLRWDGRSTAGAMVGSGVYFYRFTVDGRILRGRIAVVR